VPPFPNLAAACLVRDSPYSCLPATGRIVALANSVRACCRLCQPRPVIALDGKTLRLMNTNLSNDGNLTNHTAVTGLATRQEVRQRAVELALINGRTATEVSKADWEQAKRELLGKPSEDPQMTLLENAPESERWDVLPGSTGHQVPVTPSEDEDAEGCSENERLVAEGVAKAEHDQMLRAAQIAAQTSGQSA